MARPCFGSFDGNPHGTEGPISRLPISNRLGHDQGIARTRNKCPPPVIKHLKRGGLTIERDADGTPYRWKVHSLAFKSEYDPAGVPAVWSIGEPAARAIAVLQRLQPPGTDDLFARLQHSPGSKPNAVSLVLTSGATNARLNTFAAWINDYCQRHARPDATPPSTAAPGT
jgi:hypothetical protein